jgi:hypothetical protein
LGGLVAGSIPVFESEERCGFRSFVFVGVTHGVMVQAKHLYQCDAIGFSKQTVNKSSLISLSPAEEQRVG